MWPDVDRDGIIGIGDVTACVDIILGGDNTKPYLYDHDAADTNRDNIINVTDVSLIVNIILGQ
jgi:hypothetical protein